MPNGERLDAYCQGIYDSLCELYRVILVEMNPRIEKREIKETLRLPETFNFPDETK
jgi:hypothetical protein